MKKLKYLGAFIIISLATSCNNSDFNCNSEIAKQTVKEIWKDFESENSFSYRLLGLKTNEVSTFIDNYMKIEQVRTISKDEDLKRCQCAGKVVFDIPEDLKMKIANIKNEGGLMDYAMMEAYTAENGIDIEYTVQQTEDGDIYAETYQIENLGEIIMFYRDLINAHQNVNRKGEVIVWTPVEAGFGGDYTMTFIENDKVKIHYKYMDYEHIEYVDYDSKTYKFISEGGWEQFKFDGDFLRVEDKEGDLIYKKK